MARRVDDGLKEPLFAIVQGHVQENPFTAFIRMLFHIDLSDRRFEEFLNRKPQEISWVIVWSDGISTSRMLRASQLAGNLRTPAKKKKAYAGFPYLQGEMGRRILLELLSVIQEQGMGYNLQFYGRPCNG